MASISDDTLDLNRILEEVKCGESEDALISSSATATSGAHADLFRAFRGQMTRPIDVVAIRSQLNGLEHDGRKLCKELKHFSHSSDSKTVEELKGIYDCLSRQMNTFKEEFDKLNEQLEQMAAVPPASKSAAATAVLPAPMQAGFMLSASYVAMPFQPIVLQQRHTGLQHNEDLEFSQYERIPLAHVVNPTWTRLFVGQTPSEMEPCQLAALLCHITNRPVHHVEKITRWTRGQTSTGCFHVFVEPRDESAFTDLHEQKVLCDFGGAWIAKNDHGLEALRVYAQGLRGEPSKRPQGVPSGLMTVAAAVSTYYRRYGTHGTAPPMMGVMTHPQPHHNVMTHPPVHPRPWEFHSDSSPPFLGTSSAHREY